MTPHNNNCKLAHVRVAKTTLYFGKYRYSLQVPARHLLEFVGINTSTKWRDRDLQSAIKRYRLSPELSEDFVHDTERDVMRLRQWVENNRSVVKLVVQNLEYSLKIYLYSNDLDLLMQFVNILPPAHALEQHLPSQMLLVQESARPVQLTEVVGEPVHYPSGAVKRRASDYNYCITLRSVAEITELTNYAATDIVTERTAEVLTALSDLCSAGEIRVTDLLHNRHYKPLAQDLHWKSCVQQIAWVGLRVDCKSESVVSLLSLQFPGLIKTVKPIIVVAPAVVQTEVTND